MRRKRKLKKQIYLIYLNKTAKKDLTFCHHAFAALSAVNHYYLSESVILSAATSTSVDIEIRLHRDSFLLKSKIFKQLKKHPHDKDFMLV